MLRFHNTLGVICGAGMNPVRSSGFSRSATGRDNLPAEPPKGGTPNDLSRVLVERRAFDRSASRSTGKERGSFRQSSASQPDEHWLRCADDVHNVYRLLGPRLEITPCHGRTKEGGFVVKSSWPPSSKWPVALAKRPVPPVVSAVSWLSYTPSVSVGHRYPSKVP
jgi:hypothetical protein